MSFKVSVIRDVFSALMIAGLSLVLAGCTGSTKAASAPPPAVVEVATVVQQDTPIYSEWVATLDGYVNAEIQPRVAGYLVRQDYKEGSVVRKGQLLFEIDPRPFKAALDQAKAQQAQAEAQLGKAKLDVERDTPLAQARAIAHSQLDNEVQAELGAKASVAAAQDNVEQAELNLEFTKVTSLIDGVAGIAQVQIGNLVSPGSVLTAVSQFDPIKVYFTVSENDYMDFHRRYRTEEQVAQARKNASLELLLADGTVYEHKGS